MVANARSGNEDRVVKGYVEAVARRYGKGALAGMRNQKLGTAAAVGGVAAGAGLAGAGLATIGGAYSSAAASLTAGKVTGLATSSAAGAAGWISGVSTVMGSAMGIRGIKGMDYADNARNNSGRYRRIDRFSTSRNMNDKSNNHKPYYVRNV